MKRSISVFACGLVFLCLGAGPVSEPSTKDDPVTFKSDVTPIFKKYCLPCHAEDSNNPSNLFLDSYKDVMRGGEHGAPVLPGKPEESLLLRKLSQTPPFGDPMPMNPRRKKSQSPPKRLTEEEIQVLRKWIEQGAKDN